MPQLEIIWLNYELQGEITAESNYEDDFHFLIILSDVYFIITNNYLDLQT